MDIKQLSGPVLYYLGRWVNSYEGARAIAELTFSEREGELYATVTGMPNGDCPGEWEAVPVQVYSYSPESNDVVAFKAQAELENMQVFMAMNDNKGLLIIAGYFNFKTNEGRSDYFVREFFSKQ